MNRNYDCIFVGTSPVAVFEAAYQSSHGKSVLMIDDEATIGGAWKPIELFGYGNIENAIHYFLPSDSGIEFMRDNLGWSVYSSSKKYRAYPRSILGPSRLKFDSVLGRIVSAFYDQNDHFIAHMASQIETIVKTRSRKSYYIRGGCGEMIETLEAITSRFPVDIHYSTTITRVDLESNPSLVEVECNQEGKSTVVYGDKLFISNGTKLANVAGSFAKLGLKKDSRRRPAMHLHVEGAQFDKVHELIFVDHELIKYAHDITHYAKPLPGTVHNKNDKVFVFALHPEVEYSDDLKVKLLEELKRFKVVGKRAKIIDTNWAEVFLAPLHDDEHARIQSEFGDRVISLVTEDFAGSIGKYAERWKDVINHGDFLGQTDGAKSKGLSRANPNDTLSSVRA